MGDVVAVGKTVESLDQFLPQLIALRVDRRPVHHDGNDIVLDPDLYKRGRAGFSPPIGNKAAVP